MGKHQHRQVMATERFFFSLATYSLCHSHLVDFQFFAGLIHHFMTETTAQIFWCKCREFVAAQSVYVVSQPYKVVGGLLN